MVAWWHNGTEQLRDNGLEYDLGHNCVTTVHKLFTPSASVAKQ